MNDFHSSPSLEVFKISEARGGQPTQVALAASVCSMWQIREETGRTTIDRAGSRR